MSQLGRAKSRAKNSFLSLFPSLLIVAAQNKPNEEALMAAQVMVVTLTCIMSLWTATDIPLPVKCLVRDVNNFANSGFCCTFEAVRWTGRLLFTEEVCNLKLIFNRKCFLYFSKIIIIYSLAAGHDKNLKESKFCII